jgi:hypothetical protein
MTEPPTMNQLIRRAAARRGQPAEDPAEPAEPERRTDFDVGVRGTPPPASTMDELIREAAGGWRSRPIGGR